MDFNNVLVPNSPRSATLPVVATSSLLPPLTAVDLTNCKETSSKEATTVSVQPLMPRAVLDQELPRARAPSPAAARVPLPRTVSTRLLPVSPSLEVFCHCWCKALGRRRFSFSITLELISHVSLFEIFFTTTLPKTKPVIRSIDPIRAFERHLPLFRNMEDDEVGDGSGGCCD